MTPYYSAAGITIYHADNREALPALPAGSVDLVLTSPPYNLGTSNGANSGMTAQRRLGHHSADAKMGERGGSGRWKAARRHGGLAHGYGAHDDAMPHDAYTEWQREFLLACWHLLSERGAIYYNHKPRVLDGEVVLPLVYNPGLPVRQIVTWDRGSGINCAVTHYCSTYEWLMILAQPAFRLRDKGASAVNDLWRIPPETGTEHPAPFPYALAARVLETTKPGPVLDPYCGSGTTLAAARRFGRPAIGIEIEERFCEMAARRVERVALGLFEAAVIEQAALFAVEGV